MTSLPGQSTSPNLELIKRWAATRGLEVRATPGNQREPENIVAISQPGTYRAIISRSSLDGIDSAAFYLINALAALGVEVS